MKGPERKYDEKIKLHGDSDGIEHKDGNKYDVIVELRHESKVIEVMGPNKKFKGIDVMMMVKTEGEETKEKCSVVGPVDIGGSYSLVSNPLPCSAGRSLVKGRSDVRGEVRSLVRGRGDAGGEAKELVRRRGRGVMDAGRAIH